MFFKFEEKQEFLHSFYIRFEILKYFYRYNKISRKLSLNCIRIFTLGEFLLRISTQIVWILNKKPVDISKLLMIISHLFVFVSISLDRSPWHKIYTIQKLYQLSDEKKVSNEIAAGANVKLFAETMVWHFDLCCVIWSSSPILKFTLISYDNPTLKEVFRCALIWIPWNLSFKAIRKVRSQKTVITFQTIHSVYSANTVHSEFLSNFGFL